MVVSRGEDWRHGRSAGRKLMGSNGNSFHGGKGVPSLI